MEPNRGIEPTSFSYSDESEQTDRVPNLAGRPSDSTEPSAPFPDRLGDFILVRELGRGSFARVYLAHQESLGRMVALKVSERPNRGEAQILAGLEHDHIVRVYSEFNEAGRHGLVLQYVPGTNLAQVLAELFRGGHRPERGREILDA